MVASNTVNSIIIRILVCVCVCVFDPVYFFFLNNIRKLKYIITIIRINTPYIRALAVCVFASV